MPETKEETCSEDCCNNPGEAQRGPGPAGEQGSRCGSASSEAQGVAEDGVGISLKFIAWETRWVEV